MKLWLAFLLAVLAACVPSPWRTTPPQLIAAVVDGETRELALTFDKPVRAAEVGGDVANARVEGARVTAVLADNLTPGQRYGWSAEVNDSDGNQTTVAGRFYGPNDHPAVLKLNEVRVAGAGDRTDFVELLVVAAGSLGGWTLDAYSGPKARQRLVLPDTAAAAGQLIVIRYRDGVSDTVNATEFLQPDGRGLSASKGLLALRPSPSEPPSDGLLYTKVPGEAAALAVSADWPGREELNPDHCTPTRTWNRLEGTWIVAANGGATPGQPNSPTVWAGLTTPKKTPKPKSSGTRHRSGREQRSGRGAMSRREPRAWPSVPPPTRAELLPARTGKPLGLLAPAPQAAVVRPSRSTCPSKGGPSAESR